MLPEDIRNCVGFVGCNTKNSQRILGTAFVLKVPVTEEFVVCYMVTARHVIESAQKRAVDAKVLVRFNKFGGGLLNCQTDISEWKFHPHKSNIDVAICGLGAEVAALMECAPFPKERVAKVSDIELSNIGIGSELFISGLFSRHYGTKGPSVNNLPKLFGYLGLIS